MDARTEPCSGKSTAARGFLQVFSPANRLSHLRDPVPCERCTGRRTGPRTAQTPVGDRPLQTAPTIGDRLSDAGVDWAWITRSTKPPRSSSQSNDASAGALDVA